MSQCQDGLWQSWYLTNPAEEKHKEDCNCEQALRLQRKVDRLQREVLSLHKSLDKRGDN